MSKIIEIIDIKTGVGINNKNIRIDFRYNGDIEKKVTVNIYEQFFKLGYRAIGGVITLKKGINYWISDIFTNGLVFSFNDKIKISFDDIENNDESIHEEVVNIGNTNLNHRSMSKDMSLKNIFFLGDSNVYHYFSKYQYSSDEYFFSDKVLIPIDIPELSVNRFINSNPQKFIDSLPIMSNDIIVLNLGEIDCRVSFFRNAKLKDRTLIKHINSVVDRYIDTIIELKNNNQNIEFIICLPHPPMRNGWVKEHDVNHLLNESTEKDRMFITQYFSRYLIDNLDKIGVKHIYPFKGLEDKEGFINNEYLLPFDNHTKDNETVLNELKNEIN